VLLTAQLAAQAAVEAEAELGEVPSEDFRLANSDLRQDIIVIGSERSLTVSNQIDAAHARLALVDWSSARVGG